MQRSVKGEVIASTFDRPADGPHHGRRAGHRAGQAPGRAGPRRRRAARLDHPARPRLQPRGAGVRPHPVRWCRLDRALPAEAVLRRGPQHRERRLADDPRHGAGRDRLQDGRGHLRGVQGHRQHGAQARPQARRQADLPGGRRRRRPAPARRSCCWRPTSSQIVWKLRRVLHALDSQQAHRAAARASCARPRATSSSCCRSRRPRRAPCSAGTTTDAERRHADRECAGRTAFGRDVPRAGTICSRFRFTSHRSARRPGATE